MSNNSKCCRRGFRLFLLPLLLLCLGTTQVVAEETLQSKIGQLLMVGFRGLTLAENPQLEADLRAGKIGGVVLFDYDIESKSDQRNIQSQQQLKKLIFDLQAAAATPLLIAVDQEGGRVARLKEKYGFPPTRSAMELGEKNQPQFTRQETEKLAATLAEVGINLNLAPVVDLCSNPENPVIAGYQRCFSADPQTVSEQADNYIDAHQQHAILTSLKHFPGHGSSNEDSHRGFTDISASWSPAELTPFRKLIASGKVDTVMTAHVFNRQLDNEHPATLSAAIITGLLRKQLGFNGVVISDDMQMRALADHYALSERVRLALTAGVDILLFGNNLEYDPQIVQKLQSTIKRLVSSRTIQPELIEEAYQRVIKLKSRFTR